jgi:hypothetical protein
MRDTLRQRGSLQLLYCHLHGQSRAPISPQQARICARMLPATRRRCPQHVLLPLARFAAPRPTTQEPWHASRPTTTAKPRDSRQGGVGGSGADELRREPGRKRVRGLRLGSLARQQVVPRALQQPLAARPARPGGRRVSSGAGRGRVGAPALPFMLDTLKACVRRAASARARWQGAACPAQGGAGGRARTAAGAPRWARS